MIRYPRLPVAFVLCLLPFLAHPVAAQNRFSFQIVHSFGAPGDGVDPLSAVTFDSLGNMYGTTNTGGADGVGTVYEISPDNGGWDEQVLYSFLSGPGHGKYPDGEVFVGSNGVLYGTTIGLFDQTAYQLAFEAGTWQEQVLFTFGAPSGIGEPSANLVQDHEGHLFGSTRGTFELAQNAKGWGGEYICQQGGCFDTYEQERISITPQGQIYGASEAGGTYGYGTVYAVYPSASGWQSSDLYDFGASPQDGRNPVAGALAVDKNGNLYGVTSQGGNGICRYLQGCGSIYKLSRTASGIWQESILYNFQPLDPLGISPSAGVVADASGDLFGVTAYGGSKCSCGVVYELSPNSDGTWSYNVIHEFARSDGAFPAANLVIDSKGNLFGTTQRGGDYNGGVVFEISRQ